MRLLGVISTRRCKLLTVRVYTILLRREMAFINAFLKL